MLFVTRTTFHVVYTLRVKKPDSCNSVAQRHKHCLNSNILYT